MILAASGRALMRGFCPMPHARGSSPRRLDFRPPPPACDGEVIPDSTAPAAEPAAPRTGRRFANLELPEPVIARIRATGVPHSAPIHAKVLPHSHWGRAVAPYA